MFTQLTPLKLALTVLLLVGLSTATGCAHANVDVIASQPVQSPYSRVFTVVHAGMVQQTHAQMLAIELTNGLQAAGVASDFHVFGNLDLTDGGVDAKIAELGAQAVVSLEPVHAVMSYGSSMELTYRVTLTNLQDKKAVWVANADGTGDIEKRMKAIARNLLERLAQSGFIPRQARQ